MSDKWLCPLCSQEEVPYGTSCPNKWVCKHIPMNLNADGTIYYDWHKLKSSTSAVTTISIGIAAISDEGAEALDKS